MKIIILVSSYRKDGNTNRIAGLIEEQLISIAKSKNINLEIERIQLGHADIKICRGCRVCFDVGEEKCPLKDDLLSIRDKIMQADGILAASPVYVENINGIMKNWIDRMAFNCHRPSFAGKAAYIVTTSGIGSSNNAVNTIRTAFNTWAIKIIGKGKFRTNALMDSNEMKSRYQKKIREAAERFLMAIEKASGKKPSFYSLMAFKVQQKYWQKYEKYQGTFDYKYWSDNGWLQNNCNYYVPYKSNLLKVKSARLIGSIVAVFFI